MTKKNKILFQTKLNSNSQYILSSRIIKKKIYKTKKRELYGSLSLFYIPIFSSRLQQGPAEQQLA